MSSLLQHAMDASSQWKFSTTLCTVGSVWFTDSAHFWYCLNSSWKHLGGPNPWKQFELYLHFRTFCNMRFPNFHKLVWVGEGTFGGPYQSKFLHGTFAKLTAGLLQVHTSGPAWTLGLVAWWPGLTTLPVNQVHITHLTPLTYWPITGHVKWSGYGRLTSAHKLTFFFTNSTKKLPVDLLREAAP